MGSMVPAGGREEGIVPEGLSLSFSIPLPPLLSPCSCQRSSSVSPTLSPLALPPLSPPDRGTPPPPPPVGMPPPPSDGQRAGKHRRRRQTAAVDAKCRRREQRAAVRRPICPPPHPSIKFPLSLPLPLNIFLPPSLSPSLPRSLAPSLPRSLPSFLPSFHSRPSSFLFPSPSQPRLAAAAAAVVRRF